MENLITKGFNLSIPIIRKSFHTSCVLPDKRAGRVLKKFLGGNDSKKKFYINETPTMPNPYTFSKGSVEGKTSGNSRRAKVLNKIFMRHITDLMATGDCAIEILGHGIEINRVKIAPDYKIINVYWISKTNDLGTIESILKRSAGYLRHEMSQLRIIGEIPRIQFVKDKNYWNLAEIDATLQSADFGDDYEPTDLGNKLKNEFELLTSIDPNLKQIIHKFEDQTVDENEEVPLPPMPQHVLGLDHKEILNRINTALKKSKTGLQSKETSDEWASFKVNQSLNESPVSLGSEKSQRKAFKEFLLQRQIIKSKARSENKFPTDITLIQEETKRAQNDFDESAFFNEEPDYIAEEMYENKDKS